LTLVLLRAAVVAIMLTAPFLLLAMATGKADGLIWLMFPVVLFVPVVLASLLSFAPFEALVEKMGLNANVLLPIFGALLGGNPGEPSLQLIVEVQVALDAGSGRLVRG
jgi:hypothetical protein